jgi:chromosome segregation ATPase
LAESEERKKTEYENDISNIRKTIDDLRFEWDQAAVSRAQKALEHAESLEGIGQAHNALLEARIWHIEAESDIAGLKQRNASIMARLEEEKRVLAEATETVEEMKRCGKELSDQVHDMLSSETDEWRNIIMQLCENKTAEEIQLEIEAEEAKLELIHAANPNVIREFERRAGEIQRLQRKMEASQETLRRLTEETEELMAKWVPRLDELVSRINDAFAYNFEQISCAGEVRVHKDEDFDLWAMDIMVKFRYGRFLHSHSIYRLTDKKAATTKNCNN